MFKICGGRFRDDVRDVFGQQCRRDVGPNVGNELRRHVNNEVAWCVLQTVLVGDAVLNGEVEGNFDG
ncbi:hypothetical protein ACAX43_29185 [Paraburkholderia sp. IW21]|uniref:hypothetical protein n=1 Tax=Paraburkholderia sp. IW21 TaxID=3242488 RepID=UPI003520472D